jgi:hypothetical protein
MAWLKKSREPAIHLFSPPGSLLHADEVLPDNATTRPSRPGDNTVPFLADLIQQDLDAVQPDADRASGLVLRSAIEWRAGGTGSVLDASGNAIDKDDGNRIVDQLLRPAVFDIISGTCKAKFVQLHPDSWQLFQGVDEKPVVERLLKKVLPLTNVQGVGTGGGVGAPPSQVHSSWLVTMCARFATSQGAIPFTNIVMDLVEKQLDHVDWARSVVDMVDGVLADEPAGHAWFLYKSAGILQGCNVATKRRVFEDLLRRNGAQSMLIDALLRAGSASEDKGDDVLSLLESMDRDAIAAFIKQDARVVHVNYFLRLHALRTTPITRRAAPVKLDDGERQALRQKVQEREEKAEEYSAKVLAHLKTANPWALDRQFASWSKRISDKGLDPEKVNAMKGFITKQLDAARRAMITSDELAPFWSKKYRPLAVMLAAGAKHLEVKLDDLASMGVPGDVVNAISSVVSAKDPKATSVHVLDFGNVPRTPPFLPAELKDAPWIMLHEGIVAGIGLSGSRMKEIPGGIRDLSKLKTLDLSNNAIKHVDALGAWPTLRHLDLSRNLLASFEPAGTGMPVKFLDLHCNALKNVDVTFATPGLRLLDLSRNQITNMMQVKGFGACQKLGTVNLAWNKLDSLQDFPAMQRLVMLFLNGNGIVKLGNDATLPSVRRLDLADNNLGALKGISNFPAVFYVNARKNYLKNAKEIDSMPHLREFIASSNQIESLGDILHLKKLQLLDFRGNPLTGIHKDEERARYLFAPVRVAA